MKHLFTLLVLCLLTATALHAQTIRRCNNNPGISGPNVYTSIQAAHDAATNGDIIYVEPSTNRYGDLTSSKRLTIIGNGFYLPGNSNDSFDSRRSEVGIVTFNTGSANSRVTGMYLHSNMTVKDASITFERCFLPSFIILDFNTFQNSVVSAGDNTTFTACFVSNIQGGLFGTNRTISGTVIRGCINYSGSTFYRLTNAVITNNTFVSTGQSFFSLVSGSVISSNIFHNVAQHTLSSGDPVNNPGNTVSNNLSVINNNTSPFFTFFNLGGFNNQENVPLASVFVVPNPWAIFPEIDLNFRLSATSPARGAGVGGTDAGAFGGTTPYVLAGQPAVPIITNFISSGSATPTTPLTITISVRSNN